MSDSGTGPGPGDGRDDFDPYDPSRTPSPPPTSPAPGSTPPAPPSAAPVEGWGQAQPPPFGYGQPQYGQPQYGQPVGTPPPNHLVWAILTTLFCCLPLGIVSIVFAAQVNNKWSTGDMAGAVQASRKAKNFAIWSAVVTVVAAVAAVLGTGLLVGLSGPE